MQLAGGHLADVLFGVCLAEGRGRVGDERAHADHVQVQLAKELKVVGQIFVALPRDADHDAAADLVAEWLELAEQAHARRPLSAARWVHAREQVAVRGLEAQQIAVGAGLAPGAQLVEGALAQAQGDRDLGLGLDAFHDFGHHAEGQAFVLAGLQHDGAVAEVAGLFGAGDDLVGGHAVAGEVAVARAQAAVVALAQAVVGDFDEPAQVHLVAHVLFAHAVGLLPEVVERIALGLTQPVQNSGSVEDKRHDLLPIHATCRQPRPAVQPVPVRPRGSPIALRVRRRQRREPLGLGDGACSPVKERDQSYTKRTITKGSDSQHSVALGE